MSGFTIDSPCSPIHVRVLDKARNKMVDGRKGIQSLKLCFKPKARIAEKVTLCVDLIKMRAQLQLLPNVVLENKFWRSSKPCKHGKVDVKPEEEDIHCHIST